MAEFSVEIYQDRKGKQPFSEWLYGLKDIRDIERAKRMLADYLED